MKSQLIVVPIGGLCNRIRVVLSAFHLAPTLSLPVRVEWGRDRDCYAAFHELFLPWERNNIFQLTDRPLWHHFNTRKNLHIPGILRSVTYQRQISHFDPQRHGSLQEFIGQRQRVYIATGYALDDYPSPLINRLHPIPQLEETITQITSQFDEHTIGVHIRRTDHRPSILQSTDAAFIAAMEREIEQDHRTRFFLSTDEPQLKEQLSKRFEGRILTQTTDANRHTVKGIREAVVDLYSLAATQKILGSYYSSFSATAAEFRNIPLIVVGKSSPQTGSTI